MNDQQINPLQGHISIPVEQNEGAARSWKVSPRSPIEALRRTEFWLNKVGILLFLCGVAFLFKYAVDKNWLTEQARIGLALVLGTVLLAAGLRLQRERQHFSQVLLGGSIATYYITGYAAYVIFPNIGVPYDLASGFMILITLLAYALSVRANAPLLSFIGILGGLLTPFVLTNLNVSVPTLMDHTALVLSGASAVFMARGWRTLFWTSLAGALLMFLSMYSITFWPWWDFQPQWDERMALQGGAVFALTWFWAIPVLREVLHRRDPARWPRPTLSFIKDPQMREWIDNSIYLFVVATPLVTLAFSALTWTDLAPKEVWGVVSMGGAALFATAHWAIRYVKLRELDTLAYLHAITAGVLFSIGLLCLLEGNALLLALAVQGATLHLAARQLSPIGAALSTAGGHLSLIGVGFWLLARLTSGYAGEMPMLNERAATDLLVMALAVGASFLVQNKYIALAYRLIVHTAALAWLWREATLADLTQDGYVMLRWAVYLAVVAVISHRVGDRITLLFTNLGFVGVGLLFIGHIASRHEGEWALLNINTLLDVCTLVLVFAASLLTRPREGDGESFAAQLHAELGVGLRLLVHAGVLGLLWREMSVIGRETLETGWNFSWDSSWGYIMLAWALYLLALQGVSYVRRDRVTMVVAPFAYLGMAYFMVRHIFGTYSLATPFLNLETLLDVTVLALALATSFLVRPREGAAVFRLFVHLSVLGLLWRELYRLPDVQDGYVLLAWAAYLAALHFVAHRTRDDITGIAAHVPFLALGAAFLWRIYTGPAEGLVLLNEKALIDGAVIALVAAVSLVAQPAGMRLVYRLAASGAALALLWRELYSLPDGDWYVIFAWAACATLLHILARRFEDSALFITAHAISAICGAAFLGRVAYGLLTVNPDAFPILNGKGLAGLGVMALACVTLWLLRRHPYLLAYGLWLHAAILGWTWQELGLIPDGNNGNAYVTIGWGAYAVALVVAGLRLDHNKPILYCGLTTLFIVAAKLFLIDLAYLAEGWRIALFIGFGAAFLLLSYYFQNVVRRVTSDE